MARAKAKPVGRGRRRGRGGGQRPREEAPPPTEGMRDEVVELRGQLLLWAFVVSEAERQTARRRAQRAEREDFVREHWLDDKPPESFVDVECLVERPDDHDTRAPQALTIALASRVHQVVGPELVYVVRFALCRQGRVRVRQEGFPEGSGFSDELPTPKDARSAEIEARAIVEKTIERLCSFVQAYRRSRSFR